MSDAERMYYGDYGGCSCHRCAPCSFCLAMTEDEADIMWNEGSQGLEKFWREQSIQEENPWVVMYDFDERRAVS